MTFEINRDKNLKHIICVISTLLVFMSTITLHGAYRANLLIYEAHAEANEGVSESPEQCLANALINYIKPICDAKNAGDIPSNIKLLSPAFNMTAGYFNPLIDEMNNIDSSWANCFDGIAGNVYHAGGQPISHFMANVRSKFPGKTFYITESGYHDQPVPSNVADILSNELSPAELGTDVKAALLFNSMGTGTSEWSRFVLSDSQAQRVTNANPNVIGVNFATFYERADSIYQKAADLGYKWTLEIANANQATSTIKGIRQAHGHGLNPIIRIGTGSGAFGFEDPNAYINFVKGVANNASGDIYVIAGPNEPGNEMWVASGCQPPSGSSGQGQGQPGQVITQPGDVVCEGPLDYENIGYRGEVIGNNPTNNPAGPWKLKGSPRNIDPNNPPDSYSTKFSVEGVSYEHDNFTVMPEQYTGSIDPDSPNYITKNVQNLNPPTALRIEIPGMELPSMFNKAPRPSLPTENESYDEYHKSRWPGMNNEESGRRATTVETNFIACLQNADEDRSGEITGVKFPMQGTIEFIEPPWLDWWSDATVRINQSLVAPPYQNHPSLRFYPKSQVSAVNINSNAYTQNNPTHAFYNTNENMLSPNPVYAQDYSINQSVKDLRWYLNSDGTIDVTNYKYCISRGPTCSLRDVSTSINSTFIGFWEREIGANECDTHLAPGYGGAPTFNSVNLPFTLTFSSQGGAVGPSGPGECPQAVSVSCTIKREPDPQNPGETIITSTCGGEMQEEPPEPQFYNCSDCPSWAPPELCNEIKAQQLPRNLITERDCTKGNCVSSVQEVPGSKSCLLGCLGNDDLSFSQKISCAIDCLIGKEYNMYLSPSSEFVADLNKYRTDDMQYFEAIAHIPGINDDVFEEKPSKAKLDIKLNLLDSDFAYADANNTRTMFIEYKNHTKQAREYCEMNKALGIIPGIRPELPDFIKNFCDEVETPRTDEQTVIEPATCEEGLWVWDNSITYEYEGFPPTGQMKYDGVKLEEFGNDRVDSEGNPVGTTTLTGYINVVDPISGTNLMNPCQRCDKSEGQRHYVIDIKLDDGREKRFRAEELRIPGDVKINLEIPANSSYRIRGGDECFANFDSAYNNTGEELIDSSYSCIKGNIYSGVENRQEFKDNGCSSSECNWPRPCDALPDSCKDYKWFSSNSCKSGEYTFGSENNFGRADSGNYYACIVSDSRSNPLWEPENSSLASEAQNTSYFLDRSNPLNWMASRESSDCEIQPATTQTNLSPVVALYACPNGSAVENARNNPLVDAIHCNWPWDILQPDEPDTSSNEVQLNNAQIEKMKQWVRDNASAGKKSIIQVDWILYANDSGFPSFIDKYNPVNCNGKLLPNYADRTIQNIAKKLISDLKTALQSDPNVYNSIEAIQITNERRPASNSCASAYESKWGGNNTTYGQSWINWNTYLANTYKEIFGNEKVLIGNIDGGRSEDRDDIVRAFVNNGIALKMSGLMADLKPRNISTDSGSYDPNKNTIDALRSNMQSVPTVGEHGNAQGLSLPGAPYHPGPFLPSGNRQHPPKEFFWDVIALLSFGGDQIGELEEMINGNVESIEFFKRYRETTASNTPSAWVFLRGSQWDVVTQNGNRITTSNYIYDENYSWYLEQDDNAPYGKTQKMFGSWDDADYRGRYYRATKPRNQSGGKMFFKINSAFARRGPNFKITVEYKSVGADSFELKYEDNSGLEQKAKIEGTQNQTVRKNNDNSWKSVSFIVNSMPIRGGLFNNNHFYIDSLGDGSEYIRFVEVTPIQ